MQTFLLYNIGVEKFAIHIKKLVLLFDFPTLTKIGNVNLFVIIILRMASKWVFELLIHGGGLLSGCQ